MEIALVLGSPLVGAVLLALFGERRWAPEINAFMSFATLAAAGLLTDRRGIDKRPPDEHKVGSQCDRL